MRRKIFIIFVSLFFALPSFAQEAKVQQWKNIVAQNKKDTTTLAALDSLRAWYNSYQTDSGAYYLARMKELAETLNNKKYLFEALRQSAERDFTKGKTADALKQQYTALRLAEALNDSSLIATAYTMIGNSHKEYEDYAKSIIFYKKAFLIAKECNSQIRVELAYLNLGYVYAQLNQLDSALYYEQLAYSINIKRKEGGVSQVIKTYLGNIQFKLGNIIVAKAYYQSALPEMLVGKTAAFGTRPIVWGYLGMANCFKALQTPDSAIHNAKMALQVSKKFGYLKGIRDANKLLSELFDSQQRFDSAYHYQKLFITTNDSLYNRDKSSAIESLTFEQDLKEQEKQIELQKQKEERSHNIQLAITAIAILTAIILFLLLSRSILVSHKVVEFLSVIVLLVVFEFINLLIHPWLEKITHHSPILMLLALVAIAALIVPLHHKLEHWTTKKLVEKNKAIRLAKAKKTIEELEEKQDS